MENQTNSTKEENIGKLTTFSRLLDEEDSVVIPKVQRDYAYGRDEDKVKKVLRELLDTIFKALKDNSNVILDFVYGGPFAKNGKNVSGLIPLDGQQRLTTLFLLYFYASVVQNIEKEKVNKLLKFLYETRQSATEFIKKLINSIRDKLITEYSTDKKIKDLIKNTPEYISYYDFDPTIFSMLNVLEEIESKYREEPIDNLWDKLVDRNNIQFYKLSMDKFGLSDDLYIKMNARGKILTEFEIFKAKLEKKIQEVSSNELKNELSLKIDTEWMDILWNYAKNSGYPDIVKKADEAYMHLFRNIMYLELHRKDKWNEFDNKLKDENIRLDENELLIETVISDKAAVKDISSIFDVLYKISQKKNDFQFFWNKYFYYDNKMLIRGEPHRIREFYLEQNVFNTAMEKKLSIYEHIYFFAIYLLVQKEKEDPVIKKCIRFIRNLITTNRRGNNLRTEKLSEYMNIVSRIIDKEDVFCEDQSAFTALKEEWDKVQNFSPEEYNELLKYENNRFLQGSLQLFIDKYGKGADLFEQLEHVNVILCDKWDDSTNDQDKLDKIRINLIEKDPDYSQYNRRMVDQNIHFFIHQLNDLPYFFIKNANRINQNKILEVISKLDTLLDNNEKCKQFSISSWQYYMTKYKTANNENTKYGCYAWDEPCKPLEAIILNSSYHGKNYIEWKLLNYILFRELGDDVKYSLDQHSSSPLLMNKIGVTFSITQNGWEFSCKNKKILDKLYNSDLYELRNINQQGDTFLINFKNTSSDYDYIELAQIVIKDIEEIFFSEENE